ncbi:protein FAM110C [Molossus molossus]|uniref:protein FAM110C n=1 Tax=Molossus molossus TaxID=27622 RepID=UPI001746093A|nr:protein FAM110C [Molossus molossus]
MLGGPGLDAPPTEGRLPRDQDAARPARRSAVERLAADRAKYVRARPEAAWGPASEGSSPGTGEGQAGDPRPPARAPGTVARRAIARKPLRPDSLVIYRQKCEFVRGPGADSFRGRVRKLFPGPGKDKTPTLPETSPAGEEGRARGQEVAPTKPGPAAAPVSPARPSAPAAPPAPPARPTALAAPRSPEPPVTRRRGLQRSQSDLSSRYSTSAAEFDTFFQFCGLEPDVVEALGRENFSAGSDHVAIKVRSVSVATSESGFSRHSDEGLQEEELTEQVPSTTSVIERNARIIKWLYTCKKAKETPGPRLQGPARPLRPEAGTQGSKPS